MQYAYSYTLLIHVSILKPIGDETHSTVSGFCYAQIEYAMQDAYSYTLLIHIPILKPIGDENSEPCLWFLPCSKSSMPCSIPIVILHLYIYPY